MKFLKKYDEWIVEENDSSTIHFSMFITEGNERIILRPGDLLDRFKRNRFKDPLILDIFKYMQDSRVEKMKSAIKKKWPNVETVQDSDFPIYRGISISKKDPKYKFWDGVLGERKETTHFPASIAREKINYQFNDYTSWSLDPFIAQSYAEEREGDIKVVFSTNVKKVKCFANLYEIGDESEEIIVYPTDKIELHYKAWRV